MDVTVRSEEELEEVVGILTRYIGEGYRVILLSGDLGSGKTTLTKALCSRLGSTQKQATFNPRTRILPPSDGARANLRWAELELGGLVVCQCACWGSDQGR